MNNFGAGNRQSPGFAR